MIEQHPFLFYWLIAGILCFTINKLQILFMSSKKKQRLENDLADYSWKSGLNSQTILLLVDISALLLGFILLPIEIWCKIYSLFTGKRFFSGEIIERD